MTDAITGEVMVYQAITILQLTEKGMRIEAHCALHNDSLHDFRLVLGARSVVVKGRIERCEVAELGQGVWYRCSVDFIDPAPHVRRTIEEFIGADNPPPRRVIDGEIADGS